MSKLVQLKNKNNENIDPRNLDYEKKLETMISSGENFIKFYNGVLICWGHGTTGNTLGGTDLYETQVTFPQAFLNNEAFEMIVSIRQLWSDVDTMIKSMNYRTQLTEQVGSNKPNATFSWIAIGRYK